MEMIGEIQGGHDDEAIKERKYGPRPYLFIP